MFGTISLLRGNDLVGAIIVHFGSQRSFENVGHRHLVGSLQINQETQVQVERAQLLFVRWQQLPARDTISKPSALWSSEQTMWNLQSFVPNACHGGP